MVNWDEVFSYQTVKIISIKDKRLGLLHYFFMACILVYVIGYTLVLQKRYLVQRLLWPTLPRFSCLSSPLRSRSMLADAKAGRHGAPLAARAGSSRW